MKINYDMSYGNEVSICFPETWSLTTEFTDYNMENKFGALTTDYEVDSNSLLITSKLDLNKSFEPKESIIDLADLIDPKHIRYLPPMVFSRSQTDLPEKE